MGCLKIKEKSSEPNSIIVENNKIPFHKINADNLADKHITIQLMEKYKTFQKPPNYNRINEHYSKASLDINHYQFDNLNLKSKDELQKCQKKIEILEQTIKELKDHQEDQFSVILTDKSSICEVTIDELNYLLKFYHHENLTESSFVTIHHLTKCTQCKNCEILRDCKGNECQICRMIKDFSDVLKKVENDCKLNFSLKESFTNICQKSIQLRERLRKVIKYYKRQSVYGKGIDGYSKNSIIMNNSEASDLMSCEKELCESNYLVINDSLNKSGILQSSFSESNFLL